VLVFPLVALGLLGRRDEGLDAQAGTATTSPSS
jgi:hypothetical protein